MREENRPRPLTTLPLSEEEIEYLKDRRAHAPSMKSRLLANKILTMGLKPKNLREVTLEKQGLSYKMGRMANLRPNG